MLARQPGVRWGADKGLTLHGLRPATSTTSRIAFHHYVTMPIVKGRINIDLRWADVCPGFPELHEFHKRFVKVIRENTLPIPNKPVLSLLISLNKVVVCAPLKDGEGFTDLSSLARFMTLATKLLPDGAMKFIDPKTTEAAQRVMMSRKFLKQLHNASFRTIKNLNAEYERMQRAKKVREQIARPQTATVVRPCPPCVCSVSESSTEIESSIESDGTDSDDDDGVLLIPEDGPSAAEIELKKQCADLQKELDDAKCQRITAQEAIAEFKLATEKLEGSRDRYKDGYVRAHEMIEAMKQKSAEEITGLKNHIASLESQLSRSEAMPGKQDVALLESKLESSRAEVSNLREELAAANITLETFKRITNELTAQSLQLLVRDTRVAVEAELESKKRLRTQ